jgi:hypothetical protein
MGIHGDFKAFIMGSLGIRRDLTNKHGGINEHWPPVI